MLSTLQILRTAVGAIENRDRAISSVLPFDIPSIDSRLAKRGLEIAALHECALTRVDWGDDAAATLFLAGIAARVAGPVLWIATHRTLFTPALFQVGLSPDRLIQAEGRNDSELLAIMEDALRHHTLGAVIGEVKQAGLTATRRLQLAAEGGATLPLLLRRPARRGEDPLVQPSAAVTRWRVGACPSAPLPVAGLGRARWHVELVRQRGGAPFELTLEACDETGRCALAAELVDRPDLPRGADARAAA